MRGIDPFHLANRDPDSGFARLRLVLCRWVVPIFLLVGGVAPAYGGEPVLAGYLPHYRVPSEVPGSWKHLTDLICFSVAPDAKGQLPKPIFPEPVMAGYQKIQKQTGCRLWLSVGGWGRSDSFPKVTADPERREVLGQSLLGCVVEHGFHGVDLDWEHPRGEMELKAYGQLISELRTALDPQGCLVSVAQASWQDLGQALYSQVHRVHLMSYDHDFPQATLAKSQADVRRLIEWGCPREKILLGVPFYGRNLEREAMSYRDLVRIHPKEAGNDLIGGSALNGPETLRQKDEWAQSQGLGGLMIWELGQDTQDPNTSLFQALVEDAP